MGKTTLQEIRAHHAAFRKYVEDTGALLRDRQMPQLTEELFSLYEKTGNRLIYENDYFERRRFLVIFGLLTSWYQRKEDIAKLYYGEYMAQYSFAEFTNASLFAKMNNKKI